MSPGGGCQPDEAAHAPTGTTSRCCTLQREIVIGTRLLAFPPPLTRTRTGCDAAALVYVIVAVGVRTLVVCSPSKAPVVALRSWIVIARDADVAEMTNRCPDVIAGTMFTSRVRQSRVMAVLNDTPVVANVPMQSCCGSGLSAVVTEYVPAVVAGAVTRKPKLPARSTTMADTAVAPTGSDRKSLPMFSGTSWDRIVGVSWIEYDVVDATVTEY